MRQKLAEDEASSQDAEVPDWGGGEALSQDARGELTQLYVSVHERDFRNHMLALGEEAEANQKLWSAAMEALQAVPLEEAQRDGSWMQRRRGMRDGLTRMYAAYRRQKRAARAAFGLAVAKALYSLPDDAADECAVSEFAMDALHAADSSDDSEEVLARPKAAPPAKPQPDYCGRFCRLIGRDPRLGAPGTSCLQPRLSPQQEAWGPAEWAGEWLQIGGFARATQWDAQGWLPIHHAIQATVYWGKAVDVVIGLVALMQAPSADPPPVEGWLRAKTRGGRPTGWAPLHMAANGSDCTFSRGFLVKHLLAARAAVDDRADDPNRATPFLKAVSTGVVDVASILMDARADVNARTALLADGRGGKSAIQMAAQSSGRMRRPSCIVVAPAAHRKRWV